MITTLLRCLAIAGATMIAPLPAVYAQTSGLVSSLTSTDIGSVGKSGATLSVGGAGAFSVDGAGRGLAGWDDEFHFGATVGFQQGEIVAHVLSLDGNRTAGAGLDLRDSNAVRARHAGVMVLNSGEVRLYSRQPGSSSSRILGTVVGVSPPVWLRLQRAGDTVTAAYSKDGKSWRTVGQARPSLATTVRAGLAVTSGTTASTATGEFDAYAVHATLNTTPTTSEPAPAPAPAPAPEPTPEPAPTTVSQPAPAPSDYATRARAWDKAALERRLGPSFSQLNPGATDTRPLLYKPTSKYRHGGYFRTNPYELGSNPTTDGDYWSDSGQIGFLADASTNPGIVRWAPFAYYDRVFAISPRLCGASGDPSAEPFTRDPGYIALNGGKPILQPIAMVRNYGMRQNEALVIYRDGLLAAAGIHTSRAGGEYPYPGFKFPAHKVPTALAVTTANEFALVTVWDTQAKKGQLAVIALEAKWLPFHTWPYIGMPNQGVWSNMKLLGYVDLPMTMPSSVSAASNGWWSGPSQTGGLVLSQINLANESHRQHVHDGAWQNVVAKGGYAIVASKDENKVAVLDLAPLFGYIRQSYLSSASSFKATLAARGPGANDFPKTFSAMASITPRVVWQGAANKPTTVLAGMKTERWTRDYIKAYVAQEDGHVKVINTSSLIVRESWQRKGSLGEAGSFFVGRNPVAMIFARHRPAGTLPLLPKNDQGVQTAPDTLNNALWVACRGERDVRGVVSFEGKGQVHRIVRDKRLDDPVALSVAERGNILSVADFQGKKLHSFRIGRINDYRNGVIYGAGADGNQPWEYAGSLALPGHPYLVGSSNTN